MIPTENRLPNLEQAVRNLLMVYSNCLDRRDHLDLVDKRGLFARIFNLPQYVKWTVNKSNSHIIRHAQDALNGVDHYCDGCFKGDQ